jgi:heat shock protein HspQ
MVNAKSLRVRIRLESTSVGDPLQDHYNRVKELGAMKARSAKFAIGQVVKHRVFPFRGLIFDVDPEFDNTEEWWLSIPEEVRPTKDQPFYHLFAENAETEYIAYVSEQNLLPDETGEPLRNPMIEEMFVRDASGAYRAKPIIAN